MGIQMCQDHWDQLKKEIERVGLWDMVVEDGTTVAMQLENHMAVGDLTPTNYDPLMQALLKIMQNTIEGDGPYILFEPTGICPICHLNSKRTEDGRCACGMPDCRAQEPGTIPPFETWLTLAAEGQREFVDERGWL